jgi:hypothetical protein
MDVDVSIWGWKDLGIFWGSVGHVMITAAGTQEVILSQFPHAFGQPTCPCGSNNLLSFDQTNFTEGRLPSIVFRVSIPDEAAFAAMAEQHVARPIWDWDPMPPKQTHCARSSYDALRFGKVPIDPDGHYVIVDDERLQIIPNTLWTLLEGLSGVEIIVRNEKNLPDVERLAYEANISQYVPFSSWHSSQGVSGQ